MCIVWVLGECNGGSSKQVMIVTVEGASRMKSSLLEDSHVFLSIHLGWRCHPMQGTGFTSDMDRLFNPTMSSTSNIPARSLPSVSFWRGVFLESRLHLRSQYVSERWTQFWLPLLLEVVMPVIARGHARIVGKLWLLQSSPRSRIGSVPKFGQESWLIFLKSTHTQQEYSLSVGEGDNHAPTFRESTAKVRGFKLSLEQWMKAFHL